MFGLSGSLFIAIKPKAKDNFFPWAPSWYFTFYKNTAFAEYAHMFTRSFTTRYVRVLK
jgi:hypothetical protein